MPDNEYNYIRVYKKVHKKIKAVAGLKGKDLPDAYELIIDAGLKALGYNNMNID